MSRTRVVAEIGCNHKGDLSIAKDLVRAASESGADVAKFQKRSPRDLLTEEQYHAPHPNPKHSYGRTYGEHREALELTIDQHAELLDFCHENGIIYSTSVWDLPSAEAISQLEPDFVKIPSASNLHFPMLQWLCENFDGGIHLSLGMTSREEEHEIVKLFERLGRAADLVLYACTSGYPVPVDDLALLEIDRLRQTYGGLVDSVGFSGHHLGTTPDVAAISLGAVWIERHFTMDRNWKGTDHGASLEPDELESLCQSVSIAGRALQYKAQAILPIEQEQRNKLKFRVPLSPTDAAK